MAKAPKTTTPEVQDPAPAVPVPAVLTPDESVRQAHFQRQKEGVAHLMRKEDHRTVDLRNHLTEMEKHAAANRKTWAEENAKREAREKAERVKTMKQEVTDLRAKIKDMEAEIKAAEEAELV